MQSFGLNSGLRD